MSEATDKAKDAAKTAAGKVAEQATETAQEAADTKKNLDKMKHKMDVLSQAGQQLRELAQGFKHFDKQEKLRRIGGLVALVTLGLIFDKEDLERFKKGEDEIAKDETHEDTEAEKAVENAKKEAEEKVEKGEMTEKEMEKEFDPKADDVISAKQSATNMYAIRYYEKDGSKHPRPNRLAKICMQEKAIPSDFILKGSSALFKEGVGTYEHFRENVSSKLVHESVKDPKERARQAAVILSCCAVGRFQIVPTFFFDKMGWPKRGEEGLRALYEFIRSTDRQITTFKKIISAQWEQFHDVGLVAVAYYAGDGTAKAYKKNPQNPRFHNKQYGGHASIDEYAQKARRNFEKYKGEIPGLKEIDYVAMVIESNETGRGIIYERAKKGQGIGSMTNANPKPKASATPKPAGTRPVKNNEVTDEMEAAAKEALEATNGKAPGAQVRREINGKTYVFQREVHTNRNPNGAPGITMYEVES